MAQWQPVTNLKTAVLHHPPVVVFSLCLLVLAGAFINIGIYSQHHDIKNPDISLDWNQILGSLASLKFCTHVNSTELLRGKQEEESRLLVDHGEGSITNVSQDAREVVHVALLVPLVRSGDEPSHASISATLLGSQLGLYGVYVCSVCKNRMPPIGVILQKLSSIYLLNSPPSIGDAGKELFNISLFLQTQLSSTESNSSPTNAETKPESSTSCLRIAAPAHLLPPKPEPPVCPGSDNLEKDMPPVRTLAAESYGQSAPNAPPCLSLKFTPDPKLTVLLTKEEKALARYHLMLVSIVLLAVCSMMCLTGTLTCSRSRRHLANDLHCQKVTLLGS